MPFCAAVGIDAQKGAHVDDAFKQHSAQTQRHGGVDVAKVTLVVRSFPWTHLPEIVVTAYVAAVLESEVVLPEVGDGKNERINLAGIRGIVGVIEPHKHIRGAKSSIAFLPEEHIAAFKSGFVDAVNLHHGLRSERIHARAESFWPDAYGVVYAAAVEKFLRMLAATRHILQYGCIEWLGEFNVVR